jgi:hypothetical protein
MVWVLCNRGFFEMQVLMGFLLDEIPAQDLPLIIEFEAKSIAKKFDSAKEHMEKRGYVVSNFAQDGFALLKADSIFEGLNAIESTNKLNMQQKKAMEAAPGEGEPSLETGGVDPYGGEGGGDGSKLRGKGGKKGGGKGQGKRKKGKKTKQQLDQE